MTAPKETEAMRHQALRRRENGDEAAAAMLELAAALCEAAGGPRSQVAAVSARFTEWSQQCAKLLAAVARPLAGSWNDGSVPVSAEALPAIAERLAARTRTTNEDLNRLAEALRTESKELVRRAGEVGCLERSVQHERGRLREGLERCASLEQELSSLGVERSRTAERVGALQERLRLAQSRPLERQRLENQVREAEGAAEKEQAICDDLTARLESLQRERAELGERLVRTRLLLEELEKGRDHELSKRVREIWQLLPKDATEGRQA